MNWTERDAQLLVVLDRHSDLRPRRRGKPERPRVSDRDFGVLAIRAQRMGRSIVRCDCGDKDACWGWKLA